MEGRWRTSGAEKKVVVSQGFQQQDYPQGNSPTVSVWHLETDPRLALPHKTFETETWAGLQPALLHKGTSIGRSYGSLWCLWLWHCPITIVTLAQSWLEQHRTVTHESCLPADGRIGVACPYQWTALWLICWLVFIPVSHAETLRICSHNSGQNAVGWGKKQRLRTHITVSTHRERGTRQTTAKGRQVMFSSISFLITGQWSLSGIYSDWSFMFITQQLKSLLATYTHFSMFFFFHSSCLFHSLCWITATPKHSWIQSPSLTPQQRSET